MGRLPLSRVRPELRSRHGRPPGRYFPEIAEALRPSGPAFDGELLVAGAGGSDFAALLNRLHPSKTRVDELRRKTPATYVVFDLLDEPDLPFAPRRRGRARLVPEQLPEGRGAHRHGHRPERQDGALLPDRRPGGAGSAGEPRRHRVPSLPRPRRRAGAAARALAARLSSELPALITDKAARAQRAGKVYVDWGQNDPNRSTIAPWSLRATRVPLVSMPLRWEELEEPRALAFTPARALERLRREGDLFRPVLELRQPLPA